MRRKMLPTDKTIFLNTPIIESADHKVVIVLDRSPKFATIVPAAEVSISFRDDQNAQINGKLNKILWNCTTEAIVEFHRVMGDLYPDGRKQLRFVTSDYVGKYLTEPWSKNYVTKEKLINALQNCEPPQLSGDATSCSILPGILLALEAISQHTPIQREARREFRAYLEQKEREQSDERAHHKLNVAELVKQSDLCEAEASYPSTSSDQLTIPRTGSNCSHEEGEIRDHETMTNKMASIKQEVVDTKTKKLKTNCHIRNKGTIVLFTSIESMADLESISEYFAEQILVSNQASRTSTNKSTFRIDHVDLFILNIAADVNAPNANLCFEKRRPSYNVYLVSVVAGANLIQGVHKILQDIYGLVSTTVVGIPMKEETQQGQSVNYDVEMLHPRDTHSMLKFFGLLEANNSKLLDDPSSHGGLFSSVRLKWCTPTAKLKSEMFPLLHNAFPITPAYFYNRPSTCLTMFLQNGKNVMLEIASDAYRDQNPFLGPNLKDKLISHYLSKDTNGQLIIHCVGIGKNANLHGKLFSETIYGVNNCSAANLNDKIESELMTQLVKSNQIQPICFQQDEEMEDKDYRELENKITKATGIQPKQEEINSTKKRVLPEDNLPAREKQVEQEQMDLRIKRRKAQLATYWKPNEEINVYDWLHTRYKKEYWSKWKGDFEGRKKYGDKAQDQLYPNLKLPPGQSKGAGTGTAGPIE